MVRGEISFSPPPQFSPRRSDVFVADLPLCVYNKLYVHNHVHVYAYMCVHIFRLMIFKFLFICVCVFVSVHVCAKATRECQLSSSRILHLLL